MKRIHDDYRADRYVTKKLSGVIIVYPQEYQLQYQNPYVLQFRMFLTCFIENVPNTSNGTCTYKLQGWEWSKKKNLEI
jgi:hypothetical protein